MPVLWQNNSNRAPVYAGALSDGARDGANEPDPLASAPALYARLWAHRSLPRTGFVWFIGVTFVLMLMPLAALLGTDAMWGLLPFLMGTLALVWFFVMRSYKTAPREELRIWDDRIEIIHTDPDGSGQEWHANPHWVRVRLTPEGGPVEQYLTLIGGGRDVELGAFLSPQERIDLHDDLLRLLAKH
jgi:uncharacterized membrane protein